MPQKTLIRIPKPTTNALQLSETSVTLTMPTIESANHILKLASDTIAGMTYTCNDQDISQKLHEMRENIMQQQNRIA